MQPVAHVHLLAIIRGGFQPKPNVQPLKLSGSERQFRSDPQDCRRSDCRRRVATQIGARDWRLATPTRATGSNEEFDLGNTWESRACSAPIESGGFSWG